jgi:DMSO/TMAO reductase YedYZ heme-binding membrane subunit
MNMKKIKEWVTVKNLVVICAASTAVVALWSDNINAFLAWIWVTIYAIQDVYREDVA